MRMLCKKLIAALMALTLVLALAPAALAEDTQLQVTLSGLYATRDGSYQSVALNGTFDVYQENCLVGVYATDGQDAMLLPDASMVRLVPVPGSSMCMYFEDKKIKQRQYQTYCCGKYAFCEIYQMDMRKYEE